MTLEEIRAALDAALPLRFPNVKQMGGAAKVEALEDHMLACAILSGDLVEARHWLRKLEQDLRDQWDNLTGWEVAIKRPRDRVTKVEIEQAKISVAPTLYSAGREAKLLRESVDDQIARLERDERVASRSYTMLSGR